MRARTIAVIYGSLLLLNLVAYAPLINWWTTGPWSLVVLALVCLPNAFILLAFGIILQVVARNLPRPVGIGVVAGAVICAIPALVFAYLEGIILGIFPATLLLVATMVPLSAAQGAVMGALAGWLVGRVFSAGRRPPAVA